jgi:hypothetical protein
VCPQKRLVIISNTTGLSFALERIGPLAAIITVFYLLVLYYLYYQISLKTCLLVFTVIPWSKMLVNTFCSLLASTLLFIESTTIHPLYLWVIGDNLVYWRRRGILFCLLLTMLPFLYFKWTYNFVYFTKLISVNKLFSSPWNGTYVSPLEKHVEFNKSAASKDSGSATNKIYYIARQRCKSKLKFLFAKISMLFESGKCISGTINIYNVLVRAINVKLCRLDVIDYTEESTMGNSPITFY